jgi:hypothetical protein
MDIKLCLRHVAESTRPHEWKVEYLMELCTTALEEIKRLEASDSMDVKQRIQNVLDGKLDPQGPVTLPGGLLQDALAEIERLEASHCKAVDAARQLDALEKIAQALESIDETVTIWHNDGVPIADKLPAR